MAPSRPARRSLRAALLSAAALLLLLLACVSTVSSQPADCQFGDPSPANDILCTLFTFPVALQEPNSISYDSFADMLIIADATNGQVAVYYTNGSFFTMLETDAAHPISLPVASTVDVDGFVYLVNNNYSDIYIFTAYPAYAFFNVIAGASTPTNDGITITPNAEYLIVTNRSNLLLYDILCTDTGAAEIVLLGHTPALSDVKNEFAYGAAVDPVTGQFAGLQPETQKLYIYSAHNMSGKFSLSVDMTYDTHNSDIGQLDEPRSMSITTGGAYVLMDGNKAHTYAAYELHVMIMWPNGSSATGHKAVDTGIMRNGYFTFLAATANGASIFIPDAVNQRVVVLQGLESQVQPVVVRSNNTCAAVAAAEASSSSSSSALPVPSSSSSSSSALPPVPSSSSSSSAALPSSSSSSSAVPVPVPSSSSSSSSSFSSALPLPSSSSSSSAALPSSSSSSSAVPVPSSSSSSSSAVPVPSSSSSSSAAVPPAASSSSASSSSSLALPSSSSSSSAALPSSSSSSSAVVPPESSSSSSSSALPVPSSSSSASSALPAASSSSSSSSSSALPLPSSSSSSSAALPSSSSSSSAVPVPSSSSSSSSSALPVPSSSSSSSAAVPPAASSSSSSSAVPVPSSSSSSSAVAVPPPSSSSSTGGVGSVSSSSVAAGVSSSSSSHGHGGVAGDPIIAGFHRQRFLVKGENERVFNLLTASQLQLNSRFLPLEDGQSLSAEKHKLLRAARQQEIAGQKRNRTRGGKAATLYPLPSTTPWSHCGTYLGELGILLPSGARIHGVPGSFLLGWQSLTVNGQELHISTRPLWFNSSSEFASVLHSSPHVLQVRTSVLEFELVNSDRFFNVDRAELMPGADASLLDGLLGQTADPAVQPDNSAQWRKHVEYDYRVESDDVFSSDFARSKYSGPA